MKILIYTCVAFLVIIQSCAHVGVVTLPSPFGEYTRSQFISNYFEGNELDIIEGVWVFDNFSYEIAIIKNTLDIFKDYDYIGVVTNARRPGWRVGKIKVLLKNTVSDRVYTALYYMQAKNEHGTSFVLLNDHLIELQLPMQRG